MNHVFDMDGVILDSNSLKTEAFRRAAMVYGERAADWMVNFHQQAGSITRRERVERFFEWIGTPPGSELMVEAEPDAVERMLERIAAELDIGYQTCGEVAGVREYVASLTDPLFVVSGVEQEELGAILKSRGLTSYFDGIYGGNKHEILPRLVSDGVITLPAVYYGDTRDDYEAATAAGMEFVFVYGYTEFTGWREFFADKSVRAISDFELLAGEGNLQRARVGADGYAVVRGERVFAGRTLAGAEVTFA